MFQEDTILDADCQEENVPVRRPILNIIRDENSQYEYERQTYINDLLTDGVYLMISEYGVNKEYFMLQLANAIASGTGVLDKEVRTSQVMVYTKSMSEQKIRTWMDSADISQDDVMPAVDLSDVNILNLADELNKNHHNVIFLDGYDDIKIVKSTVARISNDVSGQCDHWYRYYSNRILGMAQSNEWNINVLKHIASERHICIVVLVNANRIKKDPFNISQLSSMISASDGNIVLKEDAVHIKGKYVENSTIRVNYNADKKIFETVDNISVKNFQLAEDLLNFVSCNGGEWSGTATTLLEELPILKSRYGISERTVAKRIHAIDDILQDKYNISFTNYNPSKDKETGKSLRKIELKIIHSSDDEINTESDTEKSTESDGTTPSTND